MTQSFQVILSYVKGQEDSIIARKSSSSSSSAEITEISSDFRIKGVPRGTSKAFNRIFWEISRYTMYSLCMVYDEMKNSSFEAAVEKFLPRYRDNSQKLEAFRQLLSQSSAEEIDNLRVCSLPQQREIRTKPLHNVKTTDDLVRKADRFFLEKLSGSRLIRRKRKATTEEEGEGEEAQEKEEEAEATPEVVSANPSAKRRRLIEPLNGRQALTQSSAFIRESAIIPNRESTSGSYTSSSTNSAEQVSVALLSRTTSLFNINVAAAPVGNDQEYFEMELKRIAQTFSARGKSVVVVLCLTNSRITQLAKEIIQLKSEGAFSQENEDHNPLSKFLDEKDWFKLYRLVGKEEDELLETIDRIDNDHLACLARSIALVKLNRCNSTGSNLQTIQDDASYNAKVQECIEELLTSEGATCVDHTPIFETLYGDARIGVLYSSKRCSEELTCYLQSEAVLNEALMRLQSCFENEDYREISDYAQLVASSTGNDVNVRTFSPFQLRTMFRNNFHVLLREDFFQPFSCSEILSEEVDASLQLVVNLLSAAIKRVVAKFEDHPSLPSSTSLTTDNDGDRAGSTSDPSSLQAAKRKIHFKDMVQVAKAEHNSLLYNENLLDLSRHLANRVLLLEQQLRAANRSAVFDQD